MFKKIVSETKIRLLRHLLPMPMSASSISSSSVMHGDEFERGDGITTSGDGTGDLTICTCTDGGVLLRIGIDCMELRCSNIFIDCVDCGGVFDDVLFCIGDASDLLKDGVEKSRAPSLDATVVVLADGLNVSCNGWADIGGADGGRID